MELNFSPNEGRVKTNLDAFNGGITVTVRETPSTSRLASIVFTSTDGEDSIRLSITKHEAQHIQAFLNVFLANQKQLQTY